MRPMRQMPKVIVPRTSAEKRRERNRRYYAKRKGNGTLISNGSQLPQPPTDDNMPTTTPSVIDAVMPKTSEGIKMIHSETNTTELGTNVAGPTTVHKKPVLATKKVALRDVQNDNSNFTRNAHSQNLIPVAGQLAGDACKTIGTKRLAPDSASSPILTNNGAHEQFNYPRIKSEFEGNKEKNVGHPKPGSLAQIQQEATQISGKNVHYGSLVGPNQMTSKPYISRFKESNDEQWADRFIRLQNFIKQCDGSDHRENMQLLVRLSPSELSKHAVELEKRAIQLTIEEGKEMQRMQALNILGKPSLTRNPISITQQKN
ncbi:hypothetical protein M8C21_001532 [Ambrosia artemisiifolia]|uniref:Uncharacterized protein n=1 Tax=Ambrosia artemisiifolia TaxID=4212 RepID=A0AAD5GHK7_AMBAR|nr:hypothetical protein M8C21_001532 [Ambrosia artemisiifolia]